MSKQDRVNFTIADQTQTVQFTYTNWKGETRQRTAWFTNIYFGHNEWHKEPQWLVDGKDLKKDAWRTFALKDISSIQYLK